jgi:hypothetical protein|tara:strand:- start:1603 stop:1800 length:198 start_codon:yes stop_codon:yes gene_type:complete
MKLREMQELEQLSTADRELEGAAVDNLLPSEKRQLNFDRIDIDEGSITDIGLDASLDMGGLASRK